MTVKLPGVQVVAIVELYLSHYNAMERLNIGVGDKKRGIGHMTIGSKVTRPQRLPTGTQSYGVNFRQLTVC